MSRKLAPVLRRKKKPRGQMFQTGNRFGLATRFKKGEPSPNAGGRPKSAAIGKAARALLATEIPGDPDGRTYAEAMVEVLAERGLSGNIAAIAEMTDRAEGRPVVGLQFGDGRDNIGELIASMREMSEKVGPPEEDVLDVDGELLLTDGNFKEEE